jgi:hypothetical protein
MGPMEKALRAACADYLESEGKPRDGGGLELTVQQYKDDAGATTDIPRFLVEGDVMFGAYESDTAESAAQDYVERNGEQDKPVKVSLILEPREFHITSEYTIEEVNRDA